MNKNNASKVIVDFDRPRELKLTFSAMESLSATEDLDLDNLDFDQMELPKFKRILFYALQYDAKKNNETLDMDKVGDILDEAIFIDVINGLFDALNSAITPTKLQKDKIGKDPATSGKK